VSDNDRIRLLAELVVRFGANVQPGQIVSISSEPGKEELARAIAEVSYAAGAKFVDLRVFDLHFKRARALHADPDTLSYVPPWYGEQMLALGAHRAAVITLTGPVEPHLMEGVDPDRLGRDMLPRVRESEQVLNDGVLNWTVAPCPTPGWAALVYPDLDGAAALEHLWSDIARVCRLDEADPVTAWNRRLDRLIEVAQTLTALRLDALHFKGPGTDLTVGLLPTSRWTGARISTAGGIVHAPNLPTEEVFTTPDPERTTGVVTSTKPLFVAGVLITGLRMRFESGRAVEIEAERGAATLRALADRGPGASRLGEVALVDRESRIGQLGTVFFDTLLDENAASHIALGAGLEMALEGDADHARINRSEIHIDFMIGSDEVAVTGITREGNEVPLLREGAWQV
jgi:aminopeptidase